MREIQVNNIKYHVLKEVKDAINLEILEEKITDYFAPYDYIVGDWAYGKLRLKGFNSKANKNFKPINDIDSVDEYLKNNCAFGCSYFIIAKIRDC
ncbi:MAG: YutD family protein [Bacilli bacterium]|nr:YutD family protein [Bacilli bacterium]